MKPIRLPRITPSDLGLCICLGFALALASACAGGGQRAEFGVPGSDGGVHGKGDQVRASEQEAVIATLDALHGAAAAADGATYFSLFDPDAVYYGTDPGERWSMDEFQAFAEPYFSKGQGWTYTPTERHVFLSPGGDLAWFDERLQNEAYGETRGSGVLVRKGPPGSPWRFVQYNLSFPVPNELTKDLVKRIQEMQSGR